VSRVHIGEEIPERGEENNNKDTKKETFCRTNIGNMSKEILTAR